MRSLFTAVFDQLGRKKPEGEPDQKRNDHRVIQLSQERNKIRDQIDRRKNVSDGKSQKESGETRSAGILKNELKSTYFALEGSNGFPESQPKEEYFLTGFLIGRKKTFRPESLCAAGFI